MSKKIIALLLCVVMALSIAACGTTTPTDDGGDDAQKTYDYLVSKGIIVRNRNKVHLCQDCLRITIGTKTENQELLAALRTM